MARNAVALVTDETLLTPALFAANRLAQLNPRRDTDIVVFVSEPALAEHARRLPLPFQVRPLAPPAAHVGTALAVPHFLRLSIPAALGKAYGRLLYLDVDTWVENARLFSLFDLDLGDHVLAAVRDLPIAFVGAAGERESILGPGGRKYLNSGVLLIDTARFRAKDVLDRVAAIASGEGRPFSYLDQSVLNRLLGGNFLELSPSFNMLTQVWLSPIRAAFAPVVVHFAGVPRFWQRERFTLVHQSRAAFESFSARPQWRALGAKPWPPPLPAAAVAAEAAVAFHAYDASFPGYGDILRFLRETPFADVVQGITAPDLAALPAA